MSAESVPADKLIGQVLASRYEILHRLGEGAMGAVYKARHVKVGRTFAVKVLHARLLSDPKVAQRFEREAELAGRLRHANVVGVVDVGEVDDMHYMVMDFAEGPDLAQLLVEAPMPPGRIIGIVRQMLEGLYHAHEQGLIHRDFKPENVIIERDSHGAELPRIVDFGIALLREGGDSTDSKGRLTTNGLVLGTPHYMAPEQAVADPIDHRIDLFALGIVIYEMLSGRLPFDGSGAEVARANLLLDPPPIAQRVPYLEVDPLLEAFARRLMAKKREARPADAKAARELLDLIERDRRAAGQLLGVSPEMSERAPAMTQPVARSARNVVIGAVTTPMRPTPPQPSPADLVLARWLAATPSEPILRENSEDDYDPRASDAVATSALGAATSTPVWQASAPPHPTLPGPPMVLSAPRPSEAHRETAIRTPLGWPRQRRRTGWIVGGLALGVAGAIAAWQLARDPTPAAREEPHVALSSITRPAPSDPPPSDPIVAPPVVAPSQPVAVPPPSDPIAVAPSPPPVASEPVVAPVTSVPPAPDPRTAKRLRDSKRAPKPDVVRAPLDRPVTQPSEPAPIATPATPATPPTVAKPVDPPPVDVVASKPASPAEHKPAKPVPAKTCSTTVPPVAGIAPKAASDLYYAIADELTGLPPDQAQRLWGRFTRYNVQTLMTMAQADRETAAVALWQIRNDAACSRSR